MSHTIPVGRTRHPMWFYEQNYALLHRLVPEGLSLGEDVLLAARESGLLRFRVEEQYKYTLTVGITHAFSARSVAVSELYLQVRIYCDAGVAEVMGYQGHRRFLPTYDYPNENMLLPDEKRQTNFLLYELLCHFMTRNRQFVDMAADTVGS